ncbi:D-alanine--D-alanine ligase [Opitutus sp. ER46]|uniref:D-alanine--D-alanine ligase family protein n=1 Tax=Opitutus sp. ER46 TaxID=2161864 RepID=UPI000D321EE6|nr:D-alanine--D-alanine ligase [Opitutus sp. ER46]PTX90800.1 D-alanine--D-alanine ligase [Opitutus sp. ER46]
MKSPILAVFAGGTSSEREVSLGSGRASALALSRSFPTRFFEINANALPAGLDPRRHVVFSTLHGTFGEDGGMQSLLDAAGVHYAGCTAAASALTMDKTRTKQAAAARGVPVIEGIHFNATAKPTADQVVAKLGEVLVMKPNAEGSSVGLSLIANRAELAAKLAEATRGEWLIERRVFGRELSVGVLGGKAMGVVEIRPKSGVYDYQSKYTKGMTEYLAPAPLEAATTRAVQAAAETAFAACGCRDYARVDFMLSGPTAFYLLEINTLPGMKETSLLPMSARCAGLDFTALVRELVSPALQRFQGAAGALRS